MLQARDGAGRADRRTGHRHARHRENPSVTALAAAPVVTITPRDSGFYRVTGPVVLEDQEGDRWELSHPEG
jgi:hypothetical protein